MLGYERCPNCGTTIFQILVKDGIVSLRCRYCEKVWLPGFIITEPYTWLES